MCSLGIQEILEIDTPQKRFLIFSITLSEFIADNCKFRPVPLGLPFLTYSLTNEKNSRHITKNVTGTNNSTDNNAINFNICLLEAFSGGLELRNKSLDIYQATGTDATLEFDTILTIFNILHSIKYNLSHFLLEIYLIQN